MCDERRELRKKRFKHEGSEKYKEVNNNIKRCMEKAIENWIGEQCHDRRTSEKEQQQEGTPIRERLDHCEIKKKSLKKMPH